MKDSMSLLYWLPVVLALVSLLSQRQTVLIQVISYVQFYKQNLGEDIPVALFNNIGL
jgi:hypothetical protein